MNSSIQIQQKPNKQHNGGGNPQQQQFQQHQKQKPNNQPQRAKLIDEIYQRVATFSINDVSIVVALDEYYDADNQLIGPDTPIRDGTVPVGYIYTRNGKWYVAHYERERDAFESIYTRVQDYANTLAATIEMAKLYEENPRRRPNRTTRGKETVIQTWTMPNWMRGMLMLIAVIAFAFILIVISR